MNKTTGTLAGTQKNVGATSVRVRGQWFSAGQGPVRGTDRAEVAGARPGGALSEGQSSPGCKHFGPSKQVGMGMTR